MKQTLITLILLLCGTSLFSQVKVKKEVDNGIFVEFPNNPEYSITSSASTYVTATENCIYVVTVQRNAIPNYHQFALAEMNWTEAEKKTVRNTLLDNVIKGTLDYTGATGNSTEIKIGNYYGRKLNYTAINPITGERGKRYSVILSVRDKVISFNCMLFNETSIAIKEKDNFLNSIKITY